MNKFHSKRMNLLFFWRIIGVERQYPKQSCQITRDIENATRLDTFQPLHFKILAAPLAVRLNFLAARLKNIILQRNGKPVDIILWKFFRWHNMVVRAHTLSMCIDFVVADCTLLNVNSICVRCGIIQQWFLAYSSKFSDWSSIKIRLITKIRNSVEHTVASILLYHMQATL